MKYSKINIKCGDSFANDIGELLAKYVTDDKVYVSDFLKEASATAMQALEAAHIRNDEEDCHVSTEFSIMCPKVVKEEVLLLLDSIPKSYTDVYLMLEQISLLPNNSFHP